MFTASVLLALVLQIPQVPSLAPPLLEHADAVATMQPPIVVTAGSRLAWDYPDSDISNVTRFEMQLDGGAWVTAGMPTATAGPTGFQTYATPFPALTPGNHTVTVRACNVDICSDAAAPLGFKLVVVPAVPGGLRVIK